MTRLVFTACVAMSAAIAAQGQDMKAPMDKMNKMDPMSPQAMTQTYTGCVAREDMKGFTLVHAMADAKMGDAMTSGDKMDGDTIAIRARFDLRKHLGHKVALTGAEEKQADGTTLFRVISVKTLAKSCS